MKKGEKAVGKKLKKSLSFIKRASKPKEPTREKISKPKSYVFRKLGAATFWLLFAFMFLVVFVNVFTTSQPTEATPEQTVEINFTTQPEAIQFAQDFIEEYFTWDMEEMGDRQERLHRYLAIGVSEEAGLIGDNDWNSTFNGATLKKVEEVSENKSHIIFDVSTTLTREVEKGSGKKSEIVEEKKALRKYIAVPVAFDGKTLGVYSTPYFTNVDEQAKSQIDNNNLTRGLKKPENYEEANNITNFLDTFFSSYAQDSPDRLAYILNDPSTVGLDGAMEFVEVRKADVYQAEKENQYIVHAEVTFVEPESQLTFNSTYFMLVADQNGRYVVEQMNAEEYIQQLTGNDLLSDQVRTIENDKEEESESEDEEATENELETVEEQEPDSEVEPEEDEEREPVEETEDEEQDE